MTRVRHETAGIVLEGTTDCGLERSPWDALLKSQSKDRRQSFRVKLPALKGQRLRDDTSAGGHHHCIDFQQQLSVFIIRRSGLEVDSRTWLGAAHRRRLRVDASLANSRAGRALGPTLVLCPMSDRIGPGS